MKLASVEIENFRAIARLVLPLDSRLTVLHGANAHGKTSVLHAIAVGLGVIPSLFPGVVGVRFDESDRRRGAKTMRVALWTTDGIAWDRDEIERAPPKGPSQEGRRLRQLHDRMQEILKADREGRSVDLPIFALYHADRSALDRARQSHPFEGEFPRYAVLEGTLSGRTSFEELVEWFYEKENEELREQKARGDFHYRQKDLSAVRDAISSMLADVSHPHIELNPRRFVVSRTTKLEDEKLDLAQLSGGYRAVLALTADLAWRMTRGNPHLDEPLQSEAIVLIDEIELHLHPSWQQRILNDLMRTFPNTQFVVTTHSPQVLTTVEPKHVVELCRDDDGRIAAGSTVAATFGAEAGDVMVSVMGVSERPENRFTEALDRYRRLVAEGEGESPEGLDLRCRLEDMSPHDPALARADLEIRQRRLFKRMAESR